MEEIEVSRRTMEENARANEELRKTNKELWRNMHRHERRNVRTRSPNMSSRDDPKPFSHQIMEEPIPPHFIKPKITLFSCVEDPESHLKEFRAQMIILDGRSSFDARCSWARSHEQLSKMVKEGFLTKYLENNQELNHEALVLRDLNTIVGGFSGVDASASNQKCYSQVVMSLDTKKSEQSSTLSFGFTVVESEDVFPHEDDHGYIGIIVKD